MSDKTNTFCAFNIFDSRGELINKCPLMFIWDPEKELFDSIKEDGKFVEWLYKYINPENLIENYCKGHIVGFSYKKNIYSEMEYKDISIKIQDLFSIKEVDRLFDSILKERMSSLYERAFKEKFEFSENSQIKDIYIKLKERYKDKLSLETITQAVRGELQTLPKYSNLSYDNQNLIINELNDTLKRYEV